MNHLTNRLYATTVLDNRISVTERILRAYKSLPLELEEVQDVDVGNRNIAFKQSMNLGEVENFIDVFKMDISLSWIESGREKQMARSAYISYYSPTE